LKSKNSKNFKKNKTSHLFYVSYFKFLYNYFLNFVVQKINYKLAKYGIVVLTGREKTDVPDADVTIGYML
jgi:hypothetical protein